jgi:hypothetical protein
MGESVRESPLNLMSSTLGNSPKTHHHVFPGLEELFFQQVRHSSGEVRVTTPDRLSLRSPNAEHYEARRGFGHLLS